MKTAEHIIETVDKLVRKYHTRDPYELCQLLGINVYRTINVPEIGKNIPWNRIGNFPEIRRTY